ncbi:MAG: FHA domain-containing protein [Oscillospiraceae bacterium]|nr:FHA domain-containing protein [Oscillospiraceae bacterium]
MKQCNNGHIFDEKIFTECPYCSDVNSFGTRPLGNSEPDFPSTVPVDSADNFAMSNTVPQENVQPKSKKGMGVTVALNVTDVGINPVRGWLVAVEGVKCGTSFTVHSEKNFIGRGAQFDIDLFFDKAVSKEGDAIIAFDARSSKFFITPSSSKNNIYHNNSILLVPAEIKDYDTIEIGSTKLVFRSFCNEQFSY